MFCVAERFEVPETIILPSGAAQSKKKQNKTKTKNKKQKTKKKKGLILDIRYSNLFVFQADMQA